MKNIYENTFSDQAPHLLFEDRFKEKSPHTFSQLDIPSDHECVMLTIAVKVV